MTIRRMRRRRPIRGTLRFKKRRHNKRHQRGLHIRAPIIPDRTFVKMKFIEPLTVESTGTSYQYMLYYLNSIHLPSNQVSGTTTGYTAWSSFYYSCLFITFIFWFY